MKAVRQAGSWRPRRMRREFAILIGNRGGKVAEMTASEFTLRADDGASLFARRWLPEGAVVKT